MSDKKPTYKELEKLIDELKSENKPQQNEKRFGTLLQASEDMITIHEPNGRCVYYNGPKCYAIISEDIVGKMPSDLFDEDVSNTLLSTFEKVVKTGESKTVEVFFDWLGERRWFSEYVYPLKNLDGEVTEIVKVCRDIHKRKIAEQEVEAQNKELLENEQELQASNEEYHALNEKLNESNEKLNTAKKQIEESEVNLRTLINTIPDLIWQKSVEGKFLFANSRVEDYFGVKEQDIIGKTDYDFVDKKTADLFRENDRKAMLKGEPSKNEEFLVFANDQHGELLETTKVPVLSENKKVIGVLGIGRNITEQKKAEAELISANKELLFQKDEYRRLFDNATISIWNEDFTLVFEQIEQIRKMGISDIKKYLENNPDEELSLLSKFKVNSVNKATLKLFKVANEQEFFNNIHLTFGKGARRMFINLIESIWNNEISFTSEVNYKTLEGDEFTALFSIHIPQKKSEQKTVPVSIQSIQDIKDAESEKEESLKKLNEAQKLSHVRSWEYFIETDTVIWSKELFNIFERSYELGAPNYSEHKSLYTKESFAIMDQAVINCVQNEVPYDIELDIYTSNGNIRHIVSKGKVKKDSNNKVIGCYGTAQDITQSKLVQNKLEQQTEKLYELNNALNQAQKLSHVGNWQWNMTTDKAEWSDEMYNIYGVTRDSFYPSNENVAKTVLPEDLTKVQRGIESLLIDKMFVPFEFRIMRPSGEVRDLYIIALEKNSQDSVFGVTKDITDQKKTEAKLINANKELEVFFYRTSHDLRAPLARIMGLLQIISPSQNLKEIKSYMELIEQSTFKLNNTLSDLIEIIQVRKGQLEKTEVDIEEVVDEIVETHNSKKEYEIELRKSFEHKTIYTDLIYLKIILRNLLSNALKFSTDFRDSYISVQTSKTDKKFEIKVEDNGIGIREEAKDHLFEMFYRGGNESSEGAGLGLFIVKDAVNKLGGKIYFESEKNKGSTFYVELPLD